MNKRTALRILIFVWPLIVGLIFGGLLGGLMKSWSMAFFFGGIGAAIAGFLLHAKEEWDVGTPIPEKSLWEEDDLHHLGQVGVGPYAAMYGYSDSPFDND